MVKPRHAAATETLVHLRAHQSRAQSRPQRTSCLQCRFMPRSCRANVNVLHRKSATSKVYTTNQKKVEKIYRKKRRMADCVVNPFFKSRIYRCTSRSIQSRLNPEIKFEIFKITSACDTVTKASQAQILFLGLTLRAPSKQFL